MVEQIIHYYVDEAGTQRLLWPHISRKLFLWPLVAFVIGLIFAVIWGPFFKIFLFTIFISLLIFACYLNQQYKAVLKRVYNIEPTGLLWIAGYSNLRQKLLINYLSNEFNISKPSKLDYLIPLIEKKAEHSKISFFTGIGVISAIVLPIWIELLSWWFEKITSLELLQSTIEIIILSVLILWLLMINLQAIYNYIINARYQNLVALGATLRQIQFELDISKDLYGDE